MADKSFGVKQLDILGTGESTISAPDRLKLDSHNVAISTSLHVGAATTIGGDLNVSGVSTFSAGGFVDIRRNVSITGIATIAAPYNTNAQVAWTVTNNSASAYRFTGPGQDGTEDNPDLYLVRGQRYIFKHEATSNHPLQIRVSNAGAAYNDGVTNNGQHSTNITFNVQHDAPAQLVYQCTSHGGMVGNIYIVGQHLANGADNRVLTATSAYGMNGESTLTYSDPDLKVDTSSDRAIVTLDGAVGGEVRFTKAGTDKLKIYNAEQETRIESVTGAANVLIKAGTDTDNYAQLQLYPNGTGVSYINSTADIVMWTTASNAHTTFKTNGNIEVNDGDIIMPNGHGIDFSATANAGSPSSASSELFDDYEEGSWTPGLSGSSSVTGQTYTSRSGYYTKIGNRVFCDFSIVIGTSGSYGGSYIQIVNLPFTINGGAYTRSCSTPIYFRNLNYRWCFLGLQQHEGQTKCYIFGVEGPGSGTDGASNRSYPDGGDIANGTELTCSFSYLAA